MAKGIIWKHTGIHVCSSTEGEASSIHMPHGLSAHLCLKSILNEPVGVCGSACELAYGTSTIAEDPELIPTSCEGAFRAKPGLPHWSECGKKSRGISGQVTPAQKLDLPVCQATLLQLTPVGQSATPRKGEASSSCSKLKAAKAFRGTARTHTYSWVSRRKPAATCSSAWKKERQEMNHA